MNREEDQESLSEAIYELHDEKMKVKSIVKQIQECLSHFSKQLEAVPRKDINKK